MRVSAFSLLASLALLVATPGSAAPLFGVILDTSSASGQSGGIYFQFSPGLNSDSASAQITTFDLSPPGVLLGVPAPEFSTFVTGTLDALPVEIANTEANNYYLHYLTFGDQITFTVNFLIPTPLTGDSGSTFSFGLTASDGITPILTNDPFGFAGEISYDAFGNFTATPLSTVTSFVPEPGTLVLLGLGLLVFRRLHGGR